MQKYRLAEGGFWILLVTILGSSLVWIESSALNVALDAIQADLQASGSQLIWVINSYLLCLAAGILISGSLGDRFGRKKIYALGIGVFTAASIACGVAPSIELLIIARAIQGIGGALMVPGSLAIITASIAEQDRGRSIGYWSSASAITTLIGPVLGGFLADIGWWRAIFFLTIPLTIAIFVMLPKVPESWNRNAPKQLDYVGALILALGIGLLTYGALQLGETSSTQGLPLIALTTILGGMILLAGFIWFERRTPYPMIDLSLFRSRTFTGTNVMTAFLYAGLSGVFLFLPLNLIQIQGYNPTLAGLATLTASILLGVLSPMAGGWVEQVGARILLTVGPFIAGVGFAALALPGVTAGPSDYWLTFFPGLVLIGVGLGITVAPLTTTVMSAAPDEKSGLASGINNAVTRTSQALATGLLGALMLWMFTNTFNTTIANLELPQTIQTELQAKSAQLGNIPIPAELAPEQQNIVQQSIDSAFINGFRWVTGIAGALAILSGGLSWILIEPHVLASEERDSAAQA